VYLHVGDGRCGSSSIQRLCADQRAALRERGLDYPSAQDMGFGPEWAHGGNGRAVALSEDEDAAIGLVAGYLAAADADRFLISAEHLLTSGDERLARLAGVLRERGLRVIAIVYIREQREWLVSNWAQGLKSHGSALPLDAYLTAHAARGFVGPTLEYPVRGHRLQAAFGAENVLVRRFQRDALRDGDVRADVMDVVGIAADDLIAAEPRRNPSMAIEDAALMRVLNSLPDRGVWDRRAFLRRSRELARRHGWPRHRDLYRLAAPATLRATAEHYAGENEEFRRTFMPDLPAPLFTSSIPDDFEQVAEDDCITAGSLELVANYFALVAQRRGNLSATRRG
jgi:hypothetical protein